MATENNVLPISLDKLLKDYQQSIVPADGYENEQHQATPLEKLLEGIVENNKSIESRLQTIEKQIAPPTQAEVSTFDTVIGYLPFVFALLICALLGRLVYFGVKHSERLSDNESKLKNLENQKLRENIDALKSQIAELTVRLETQSKLIADQQKNSSANQFPTRNNISSQPATNLSKSVAPPPPPLPAWTEFVEEYNGLKNLQGINLRNGITEFIRKYDVKGFVCENVQERMNNPHEAPKFAECPPNRCDYWLYMSKDGKIVVVPSASVTSYNDNIHNERAMSTLFDSNFVGGKTYVEISVQTPAILNSSWNIEQKGLLRLR